MHSPDSHTLAAEAEQSADKHRSLRSTSQVSSEMSVAVAAGDASAAAELLEEARPLDDASLAGLIQKCKVIVRRAEWLDAAIHAMRRDLEEDRFASATGHFREALGLSRGLPLLKARVDHLVERSARELLPLNWRIVETMLAEAGKVDPPFSPDAELLERIKQARHDELVTATLYKAERLEVDGKNGEARLKLEEFLAAHPKEPRIAERIYELDHPALSAAPELAIKIPASEVQAMAALRPSDSELDTEGTVTDPAAPWRTRVMISNSAWTAIKNFSAVAATIVMLSTAGFLIWMHFHVKPSQPAIGKLAVLPLTALSPQIPVKSAQSIFQDVPIPPSEQDNILQAVRAYSDGHGETNANEVVDEVVISGNQATVKYRSKGQGRAALTYTLVKQAGTWKVQGRTP